MSQDIGSLQHRFDDLSRTPGPPLKLLELLGEMIAWAVATNAAVGELNRTIDSQERHIRELERRVLKLEGVHGA